MSIFDLPIIILQQIGAIAVQHARLATCQRSRVFATFQAEPGGFYAVNLDFFVVQKRVK